MDELKPLYEKVDEYLPYFWNTFHSRQGTFRILGIKYMIADQLASLKEGKYLFDLELVNKLSTEFTKYIETVSLSRRGENPVDSSFMGISSAQLADESNPSTKTHIE